MPGHIHLLISEAPEKDPSVVMQALKLGFARRVLAEQRRHSHPSQANLFEHAPRHVWQKRFYDFNVWTARTRVEKLRYMHRNPVQRGLVASPELWRWSSFRAYLFGEAGPVAVNKWDVLKMKIRARRLRAKSIVAGGADRPLLENREKWRTPSSFWSTNQDGHNLYSPRRSGPPAKTHHGKD
jgi:REP element-mobilizing transposase RayT